MIENKYPTCSDHPYAGFRLENQWGRCVCPKCGKSIGWVKPTDPYLLERPACPDCGQTGNVHLLRTVQINGNSLVKWHCETCEKFASQALPHARVLHYFSYLRQRYPERNIPTSIDDIQTAIDFREGEPCYICGAVRGTEFHHFLPQTFRHNPRVAPNWETWQTCGVRLCRPCHELWHELVAPMALLAGVSNGANHA